MKTLDIVGVDPSMSATGIAFTRTATTTVKDSEFTGDKRLVLLYAMTTAASDVADVVILEDLPANAMSAGITGRSQGVVRLALQQRGVPYIAVPPATLKKAATGKGNCKKDLMREAMQHHFTEELPAKGPDKVDDNQVDAWWLREVGLYLFDQPSHIHDSVKPNLAQYKEQADVIREVFEDPVLGG